MNRPPEIRELPKYPIAGGVCLLALGVTLACWAKVDMSALMDGIEVRRGQVWRLLTSTLLHADVMHLAFNLAWTWIFGTTIERIWGHWRTLLVLALLALGSSAAEYAFLDGGVGLSGVGYGLFGLLWVLSKHDRRFQGSVDQRTAGIFVGWFFLCIALTMTKTMPVANVAHGAGAVLGALLGWAIVAPRSRRIAAGTALAAIFPGLLVLATVARPWVNFSADRGAAEARLGYEALMANRNDEAVKWCRDALRMRPAEAGTWLNLGIACERLSRADEARAAYQRAHELDPQDQQIAAACKSLSSGTR